LTKIDPSYPFLLHASVTLITAIVLSVASTLISLWAFKTENYYYVMSYSRFFQKNAFNEQVIRLFLNAKVETFERTMVYDYLTCNRINSKYNDSKLKKIILAQILLLIGILLIPIILVILFHASVLKSIHTDKSII
jgi:hypothetical protein